MFRNLSGYIFSVLQAFILAIAPIILVIAVLPGSGKRVLISAYSGEDDRPFQLNVTAAQRVVLRG